jgi:hypothetical protein
MVKERFSGNLSLAESILASVVLGAVVEAPARKFQKPKPLNGYRGKTYAYSTWSGESTRI